MNQKDKNDPEIEDSGLEIEFEVTSDNQGVTTATNSIENEPGEDIEDSGLELGVSGETEAQEITTIEDEEGENIEDSGLALGVAGDVQEQEVTPIEEEKGEEIDDSGLELGASGELEGVQDVPIEEQEGEDIEDSGLEMNFEKEAIGDDEPEFDPNRYPQLFGNYLVLDHLIDGGMAKICRARHVNEKYKDVAKVVAIKMVKEEFSHDPSYKMMFSHEIKVSFGLDHPNIPRLYDYGMIQQQLFVSMEYLDGKDLNQIVRKLNHIKKFLPVPASVYIIAKACEGLHYAHNYVDKETDKEYKIIHRDISPHNIMLTADGLVKVIDFGIARTEIDEDEEEEGTIKGKISYLAPEYLLGNKIDHRYDQFQLGLTLWELLTGRRVFIAENDIATLKQVLDCYVASPTLLNKNVPKALSNIVLKSLSKNPEDRYSSMQEFNKVLVKFLKKTYPNFNFSSLRRVCQKLFKEEMIKDQQIVDAYQTMDVRTQVKNLLTARKQEFAWSDQKNFFDFGIQENTYMNNNVDEELQLDFAKIEEIRKAARMKALGRKKRLLELVKKYEAEQGLEQSKFEKLEEAAKPLLRYVIYGVIILLIGGMVYFHDILAKKILLIDKIGLVARRNLNRVVGIWEGFAIEHAEDLDYVGDFVRWVDKDIQEKAWQYIERKMAQSPKDVIGISSQKLQTLAPKNYKQTKQEYINFTPPTLLEDYSKQKNYELEVIKARSVNQRKLIKDHVFVDKSFE